MPKRESKYRQRICRTVEPVAVFSKDELDRIITTLHLMGDLNAQPLEARTNIVKGSKELLRELRTYRRQLTQYYKLAE